MGKAPTDMLVFCKWDFVVSSAASCGLQEGRGGRNKPAWPSPGAALVLEGCSRMQHTVKKDAGGKCGDSLMGVTKLWIQTHQVVNLQPSLNFSPGSLRDKEANQ